MKQGTQLEEDEECNWRKTKQGTRSQHKDLHENMFQNTVRTNHNTMPMIKTPQWWSLNPRGANHHDDEHTQHWDNHNVTTKHKKAVITIKGKKGWWEKLSFTSRVTKLKRIELMHTTYNHRSQTPLFELNLDHIERCEQNKNNTILHMDVLQTN